MNLSKLIDSWNLRKLNERSIWTLKWQPNGSLVNAQKDPWNYFNWISYNLEFSWIVDRKFEPKKEVNVAKPHYQGLIQNSIALRILIMTEKHVSHATQSNRSFLWVIYEGNHCIRNDFIYYISSSSWYFKKMTECFEC